ncbi:hypothetical protein RF11_05348 [Thelohanellus kitauei]|uniref:Uncharacterized protein n=1 Tax=Thelohanellus kitauei TaxID=669202 RepID=A0A0C2NHM1_THEKT|nr:hypothetical protein RF11_05348 [Thelohanellus kitauei]
MDEIKADLFESCLHEYIWRSKRNADPFTVLNDLIEAAGIELTLSLWFNNLFIGVCGTAVKRGNENCVMLGFETVYANQDFQTRHLSNKLGNIFEIQATLVKFTFLSGHEAVH